MTDARKLIQLFQNEKAYVHMVGSAFGDISHRKFIIDQFKNLGTNERRPIKTLAADIERDFELNPVTGNYQKRTVSQAKDRGKGKPQKAYIKAKCCTLAPQDGQIRFYVAGNAVGLVFNSDYCDPASINKHVYRINVASNNRDRLYSKYRKTKDVEFLQQSQFVSDGKSTATEKLKEYNRTNRQLDIIANHTENESVKPSLAALQEQKEEQGGIIAPRDDLTTRLNALDFKHYIEDELKLDLPIVVGGPHITLRAYTRSAQCEDVLTGLLRSRDSIPRQFANKIWASKKIDKTYFDSLSDDWAGEYILNLAHVNKWDFAKHIIETRDTANFSKSHTETNNTTLHLAVEDNKLDIALLLCKKGADITLLNSNNQSPLSMAIVNKNYAMVEILVNNFIISDTPELNDQLSFAIFSLIRAGNYDLAEMMLDRYVGRNLTELNQKIDGPSGKSALHYATLHRPTLAMKLVEAGADICLNDERGRSPLTMVSPSVIIDWISHHHQKMSAAQINKAVSKLIDAKQFVAVDQFIAQTIKTFSASKAGSLLDILISKKEFNLAENLLTLRQGQPLEWEYKNTDSPLHVAVANKQQNLIKLLCEQGASIIIKNYHKLSPLSLAAFNNDINLVNDMLQYGKLVGDATDHNDQLAYTLFLLIKNKHYAVAEVLLDSYSNRRLGSLNKHDEHGNNTLILAANGLPATIDLINKLVKNGASIGNQNALGQSSIDSIITAKHYPLAAEMVIQRGNDLTPLQLAEIIKKFYDEKQYALALEILIQRGSDLAPTQLAEIIKQFLQDARQSEIKNFIHDEIRRFISDVTNKLNKDQADYFLSALISEKEFDLVQDFFNIKRVTQHEEKQITNDGDDFTLVTLNQGNVDTIEEKCREIVDTLLQSNRFDLLETFFKQRTVISSPDEHPRRLFSLLNVGENDLAKLFVSLHTPFNYMDPESKITTLHLAVKNQDESLVRKLLQASPLSINKDNVNFRNAELKRAAQFLVSHEKPVNLLFLLDMRGSVADKRQAAVILLREFFTATNKIEDVMALLDQLQKLKPDYLYNRQHFGGLSLRRHQWLGCDTSNLWTDIMKMGTARLLELGCQDIDKTLQTRVETHLQQRPSAWSLTCRDSTAFKLFRKLKENNNNPETFEKVKSYAMTLQNVP